VDYDKKENNKHELDERTSKENNKTIEKT